MGRVRGAQAKHHRLGQDHPLHARRSGWLCGHGPVRRHLPGREDADGERMTAQEHWNPLPARCSECDEIIDAHPASREDGRWMGWCQTHGEVVATYPDSSLLSDDEEDRDE